MAKKKEDLMACLHTGGFTFRQAEACVDTLIDWFAETLGAGESVQLRGFGTFRVEQAAARNAVLNGQPQTVPAHGQVTFRPSKKLKAAAWGRRG